MIRAALQAAAAGTVALLVAMPAGAIAQQPSTTVTAPPTYPPPVAAPVAERRPRVDTIHAEVRSDDWFWLRHKSDPAVAQYLEAENAYARAVLAPTSALQERLYEEMLSRIKQTDLSVPTKIRGWLYYTRTEEGKQYPIFARKRADDAPEQITLDVNELAVGHPFMAVGAYVASDDGNLLAFSTDSTGFRQYTLRVKDLRTGEVLPDRREKVVTVAWAADNRTLFYTVEDPAKRSHRVYRMVLGEPNDELVYEERDERFGVYVNRGRSGSYLFMSSSSLTTSEVRYLPADAPANEWRVIAPRRQDIQYSAQHHGDRLYIRVNDTGRNYRLVWAPVSDPSPAQWTELLPHRDDVMLEGADFFANHWAAYERRNALNEIRITDLRSGASHEITFPEPVYSAFATGNAEFETRALRFSYQSFVMPASVYDYDMDSRERTLLKQTEVLGGFDPSRYTTERTWATASDGTRIPVSLVYRSDVPRDGSAPALLYAYGSYGASIPVSFSSNRLSLLDRGFVYALAHIRGGGDMGKAWHDQGRMFAKMNTFTDFIAAAEHLVAERYTLPAKLVIEGGSAGGLLMGAVANMRPDLFAAVVSHVPFVDVINTMLDETLPLTVGEFEEWGNPKKPDEYAYIRQYSPYDNLRAQDYPAMLVKTAFNDSQVMYHEPAKYVARLRSLKTDTNPLLLVTNMGAGHGGASGRYDRLREIALDYAFMISMVAPESVVVQ